MALLWEARHQCPSAVPLLFVHDEVVIEVDEQDAEAGRDRLVKCMADGMAAVCDPVPVEVEAAVTRTGGEMTGLRVVPFELRRRGGSPAPGYSPWTMVSRRNPTGTPSSVMRPTLSMVLPSGIVSSVCRTTSGPLYR